MRRGGSVWCEIEGGVKRWRRYEISICVAHIMYSMRGTVYKFT